MSKQNKAGLKSFKEWMATNFEHYQLADIVNHGIEGGFPGLTYYSETIELYKQFEEEIWDMLEEDAESEGKSALELIASFGGAKNVCSGAQFENLLVWYAAERVAHELTQGEYLRDE